MIKETSELKKGDGLLWWSGEFQAYLQLLFTKRGKRFYDPHKRSGKKSHHSLVYDVVNERVARELNVTVKVQLSDFSIPPKAGIWIYRMKRVPQEIIDRAVNSLWSRFENKPYAFLQWETYPSRWLAEILNKYKWTWIFVLPLIWFWMHDFKD